MMWDNWLTIIVAAAAGFVVGGLWYGPLLGKAWMAEHGFTEEELAKGNMVQIYGTTFVLSLISALFLGHLLAHFDPGTRGIMMISSGIAVGFVIPALATNYLFSRASLKLFLIDAGYWLFFYIAMGAIFALMG